MNLRSGTVFPELVALFSTFMAPCEVERRITTRLVATGLGGTIGEAIELPRRLLMRGAALEEALQVAIALEPRVRSAASQNRACSPSAGRSASSTTTSAATQSLGSRKKKKKKKPWSPKSWSPPASLSPTCYAWTRTQDDVFAELDRQAAPPPRFRQPQRRVPLATVVKLVLYVSFLLFPSLSSKVR